MSIKQRLILSNIGMIVLPIVLFLLVEIVLGYVMFVMLDGRPEGSDLQLFLNIRFTAMICILLITNGLLTYFVSRSILSPIRQLIISARKISEGNLEYSVATSKKDELAELSNTFEAMRLSLKQAKADQVRYERNRQELIASISHDLSTPLTSIKGYVKGIQDGVANTPAKLERYLNIIYTTANDMENLIGNLFQYSKLDIERIPFQFEEVNVYSFFKDFVDELAFDLEKEDGMAILEADPHADYIVKADREQLKRVVTNIVQNSQKYMDKERKEIRVQLTAEAEEIKAAIQDNGRGIAKQDLPLLFNSFYRTDASRNSTTGGSGLGLAIVKKIIEEHGGKAWAESEQGKGTCIYFTLKKVST